MSDRAIPHHLLTVGDLDRTTVAELLCRADELRHAGQDVGELGRGRSASLLFLTPSLRTRTGHAAAAARLGLAPVTIDELRFGMGMSASETFADTLRVVSGLTDLVITRTPFQLDRSLVERESRAPVINGGDGGNEHPTQALIDLAAITAEAGPVDQLRVGMVGDLGMHAARSLVRMFELLPPVELRLIAPPGRDDPGFELLGPLAARTRRTDSWDTDGLDVVYMVGLPEGQGAARLDDEARALYALSADRVASLDSGAVVLCPLPRIDEISDGARYHPSVRMFQQSDRGLFVRMAVIERLLDT